MTSSSEVGVDGEGVGLAVYVLHGDCPGTLDLGAKVGNKVLVDDAVAAGEECQHVVDEILFSLGCSRL